MLERVVQRTSFFSFDSRQVSYPIKAPREPVEPGGGGVRGGADFCGMMCEGKCGRGGEGKEGWLKSRSMDDDEGEGKRKVVGKK